MLSISCKSGSSRAAADAGTEYTAVNAAVASLAFAFIAPGTAPG